MPCLLGDGYACVSLLRDIQDFWYSVIHEDHVSCFFTLCLEHWLDFNLSCSDIGVGSSYWSLFFGIAVYELWRYRNRLVFPNSTILGQVYLCDFVMNQALFVQHLLGCLVCNQLLWGDH